MALLEDSLNTSGVRLLGLAMPALSPNWTDGTLPQVDDATMALTLNDGSWRAPLAGTLRRIDQPGAAQPDDEPPDDQQPPPRPPSKQDVTLTGPVGQPVRGPGMLLTLFPQASLRLARLYAQVLEPGVRLESDRGQPLRPVPRYFFYAGAVDDQDRSGNIAPGELIGQAGALTIYDSNGLPIDPLAVASVFQALMLRHNPLQHRPLGNPFVAATQLQSIAELAGPVGATPAIRLRLSGPAGEPYGGLHIEGISAVASQAGLFELNAAAVPREAASAVGGSFPPDEARLLIFGPATTGRLTSSFTPPALPNNPDNTNDPTNVRLARDFFSLRVVQLKSYLLGEPNNDFVATQLEQRPSIRLNEPLTLLADGNDVLGAANQALSGAPVEALCVAQSIDGDFAVPTAPGAQAHWDTFPPPGNVVEPPGALPIELRDGFAPTAQFFDDGNLDTANVDMVLTLNGLPPGAAVRVYSRSFVADAREARGDGAGGVAPDPQPGQQTSSLSLLLRDPLGLRGPGVPDDETFIPTQATLRCDVIVVKRGRNAQGGFDARVYGNVAAPINGTTTVAPPSGTNPFGTAARRGISNARILGRATPVEPLAPDADAQTVLARLTGEGNPRDASRWPTMARRDLLVAGLSGGSWRGVIAGGRLARGTHGADARLGAPGGPGGRETQVVGVATQNGRLAYDIARMAFRRTNNILARLAGTAETTGLANANWAEPAEPPELATGAPANVNSGTFAGAVLQTIAQRCETPELSLLRDVIVANADGLLGDFDDLIGLVTGRLGATNPLAAALNALSANAQGQAAERLFNELQREIVSSCFGRRDTQWALQSALASARHFVYIESPGFAATRKTLAEYQAENQNTIPPYAADLLVQLGVRMGEAPGLRTMICIPRAPDYAPGYEPFTAREVRNRRQRIRDLPSDRTVAFHPIGFPGRPSGLESFVVIVDDVWALIGSSSWRRRGLTFDGASDLVFTDTDLVDGRSPAIAAFRRRLMAARLGVAEAETNAFGRLPDPSFVRLRDGSEAFHVVRELRDLGGLGRIERLTPEVLPGIEDIQPDGVHIDLANPDGEEFAQHLAEAILVDGLVALSSVPV